MSKVTLLMDAISSGDFAKNNKGGNNKNNNQPKNQPNTSSNAPVFKSPSQYDKDNLYNLHDYLLDTTGPVGAAQSNMNVLNAYNSFMKAQEQANKTFIAEKQTKQSQEEISKFKLDQSLAKAKMGKLTYNLANENSLINQLASYGGRTYTPEADNIIAQAQAQGKKLTKKQLASLPTAGIGDVAAHYVKSRQSGGAGLTNVGALSQVVPAAIKGGIQLKEDIHSALNPITSSKKTDRIRAKHTPGKGEVASKRDLKALAKADRMDAEARAQRTYNAINKVKTGATDIFTGLKDTVSEKSLAKRVSKEGMVGVQRRNARLAYLMGDRSWSTKALSGHGTNVIQKLQGRAAARKQRKNVKNYYKQFAEETTLDHALNTPQLQDFVGLEGKADEYQIMYNILNMDFESLDQKYVEQGNFSELETDVSTPVDGRPVNPDDLKIGDGMMTLGDVLNKNFYEASKDEKKFQEMVARGFSQDDEPNPYEQFLEKLSYDADSFCVR